RAEVFDDTDHPNVEAAFEVPGVAPSDLRVSVKHGILIIEGQRQPRHCPTSPQAYKNPIIRDKLQEFHYGKFYRALRLPSGTKAANLTDGVLTVTWPQGKIGQEEE
ncbi:hypothetical protein B0H14DRAFT_2334951, partial [Mycena olivaceomarginata]